MAVVKNTFEADVSSYERALRKLEEAERKLVSTVETGTKSIDKAHKKNATSAKEAGQKTKTAFKEVKKEAGSLTKSIDKIGARLLAAFAIERVLTFFATTTREMINLAQQAVPVRAAFERIGDPKLLKQLRDAVRGTVSDLELMKQAVRASNFKIPLEEFARLLEFAQRRARETGESVDFLVNSIVAGIGRKSPLILDNLGISAIELRKRLKGVGVQAATIADVTRVVGDIVEEEFEKMGKAVDNNADKVDRAAASYDNLQAKIGEELIPTVGKAADSFTAFTEFLLNDSIPTVDKFGAGLLGISGLALGITGDMSTLSLATKGWTDQLKEVEEQNKPVEEAQKRWEEFARALQFQLKVTADDFIFFSNAIDPLFDVSTLKSASDYETRIKELKKVIDKLSFGTDELITKEAFLVGLQEKLSELQGKTTKTTKELTEERERAAKAAEKLAKLEADQAEDLDAILEKDFEDFLAREAEQTKVKVANANAAKKEDQELLDAGIKAGRKLREVNQKFQDEDNVLFFENIEKRKQARADELAFILDTTQRVFGAIAQFSANIHNAELEQIRERTSAEMDSFDMRESRLERELELDLARLDRADISESKRSEAENVLLSQFDTRIEAEKQGLRELEQERKAVQIRAAQDAKALAVFEAIINVAKAITAQGVTTPQAIAAGVLGAIQIALIEAQPLPSFKEGIIDYRGLGTTKSDSNVVRISDHESIINAAGTHAYPDILLAANNLTLPALIDKEFVQPAVKQAVTDIWPIVASNNKDKNHHVIISNVKDLARATADQQFVTSYLDK